MFTPASLYVIPFFFQVGAQLNFTWYSLTDMQLFKSKDELLQFTLNLESSKKFSLEQGITATNENTLEALKRFSSLERQSSKTFYLWGKKGSGKTFWLRSWQVEKKRGLFTSIAN